MPENLLNQKSIVMSNKDEKYSEWIHQIKVLEIKLPNSQDFTSKTMSAIELLPKKKNSNKWLNIISLTSSIAASFLVGLFLVEQFVMSPNIEITNSKIIPVSVSYIYEINREQLTTNDINSLLNSRKEKQKSLNLIINKYKTL